MLPDLERMLHDYADAAQLLHAGSSEEGVAATHEVASWPSTSSRAAAGRGCCNVVVAAWPASPPPTRWPARRTTSAQNIGQDVPLLGMSRSFGALTLYFAEPIVDEQDAMLARATSFATHFTLALGCGPMVGSRLTADTAFAYLQRLSQHSNRKLRDIAAAVVSQRGPIHPVPEPTPDQTSEPLDGNTVHSGGGAALPETAIAAADPTGS